MNIRIRFGAAFVYSLAFILFACNFVPLTTEPTQPASPPSTAMSDKTAATQNIDTDSTPTLTALTPTSTHVEETAPLNPTNQSLKQPATAPTVDISTMSINLKQELYFIWAAEGGPLSPGTSVLFAKYNVSEESINKFLEDGTTPPELQNVHISPFFTAFFDSDKPVDNRINLCIYGFPENETVTVELYTPEDTLCVSQDIRVSDYYYLTVGGITEVDFSMDWPPCSHAGQWSVVVKSATINPQKEPLKISWYQMARFSISHACNSSDGYISIQGTGYPPSVSRLLGVYGPCLDSEKDFATVCKLLESYLAETSDDGTFSIAIPSNLLGRYIVVPVMADNPPDMGFLGIDPNPEVTDYPELCRYHRELYLTTPALQGGDVRAVQQRLIDLGYSEVGEVDGYFNAQTESAVVQFQKMNGFSQNGRFDEQTLNAIMSDDARPADGYTSEATADTSQPPVCLTTGATWTRTADGMTLVCVPGGTFQMGSTDAEVNDAWELCNQIYGNCQRAWFEREQPIHTVTLDGFWLDRTEVTNKQYDKCVASGACTTSTYANDANFNGGQQPVVGVDWYNATAYCAWVGGQLPTEAQWEYAARGPEGYIFPWGNTRSYGAELNYCDKNCTERWADKVVDDGYLYPAPVGSFLKGQSWAGALDMAGNVMEWTADRYGNYSSGAQTNPTGPSIGDTRVGRGGSWHGMATSLRSAYRNGYEPTLTNDNLGFRCVIESVGRQ